MSTTTIICPHTVKLCSMYDMLLDCAKIAEAEEITLNLEALNITTDHVGNFLATTQMGAEIVRLIGSPAPQAAVRRIPHADQRGLHLRHDHQLRRCFGHIHVADSTGPPRAGYGRDQLQEGHPPPRGMRLHRPRGLRAVSRRPTPRPLSRQSWRIADFHSFSKRQA